MEQQQHKRRPRYKGTHPRRFEDKYKELNPEKYREDVDKIISQGKTPAGMHIPIMVEEILDFLERLRPALKEVVPHPQRRAALHAALFQRCLEVGGPLNDRQLGEVLEEMREERDG